MYLWPLKEEINSLEMRGYIVTISVIASQISGKTQSQHCCIMELAENIIKVVCCGCMLCHRYGVVGGCNPRRRSGFQLFLKAGVYGDRVDLVLQGVLKVLCA